MNLDMLPAFLRVAADHLPKARITFDKFHVVARASATLDQIRRLAGLRWTPLKDRHR